MSRPAAAPTLTPGTEVAGYVIDERIGSGGFGEVYRATQPVIGRTVAIKILHARYSHDPDAVARFVDEARAVNRISHPGIIEVFDFGRFEGRDFFTMELATGKSLRDVLAERGAIPLAEALPILRGIAEAVDAAHAAGIAHRDLKPDNVFLLPDGRTKLIDFGLAKLVRETETVTETGSVFGTPLYMSPEQCRGRGVDTRTDLYSFGVLTYHVLVGQPPFAGDPLELALHHLNDAPPSSGLGKRIDRVLFALLAKDPNERPTSLVAAVAALEGGTLRVRRKRSAKALLLLLPLGAIAGGVVYLNRTPASTCEDRMAAVWNQSKRDAMTARFGLAPQTLRVAIAEYDRSAKRWSEQWQASCHADREADPLLHAQRVACLETALIDLRDDVESALVMRPLQFADSSWGGAGSGAGGRSLTDCENPAVLRAQVPPPPVAVRAQVAEMRARAQETLTEMGRTITQRDMPEFDRLAVKLDAITREIEALDPPSAGFLILARVDMMAGIAMDMDVRRMSAVREARADAVRRLEAARDDVDLAQAHLSIVSDMRQQRDLDAAASALDRAEQTIERAGRPIRAVIALEFERAEYAVARGQFDEAAAWYRKAIAASESEGLDPGGFAGRLVMALARGEHPREAKEAGERAIARITERYGPLHPAIAGVHMWLAMAAEVDGDLVTALGHERAAVGRMTTTVDMPSKRNKWGWMYITDLELRLHVADETIAAQRITDIAGLGTTPAQQNPDGPSTARRAGLYADYEFGADRATGDAQIEHAATRAFHRGDLAAATQLAAKIGKPPWMPFARWLAVMRDKDLDAKLVALEHEFGDSPYAIAYSGIVLAAIDRWDDARAKLEAARKVPNMWELQADLADLATWLGLARMRAGDLAGARVALEEALLVISISYDGYDGFSYTTPIAQLAMAELLVATESRRAIALARRAEAGFKRLGRTADQERAAAWLAKNSR